MSKVVSSEEFRQLIGKNTLAAPYSPGGTGTGNVIPNDFGNSQYDDVAGISDLDNINDYRAEKQTLGARWTNGATKALVNVPIRVVDAFVSAVALTAGGLANIGDLFTGEDNNKMSDYLNNPVTQALDGLSNSLQEAMPVYRTDEYNEAGIGGKLLSGGTFWADTMTDAASFMLSSYIGGAGVGSLLGKVGNFNRLAAMSKVNGVLDDAVASGIGNKGWLNNMTKSLVASTYAGVGESSLEARETYKAIIERGGTEDEARAAMNASMITNMVLTTGANFITFGKQFAGSPKERILNSTLLKENAGKLGVEELTKSQKALSKLSFLTDAGTEGIQEGAQFSTNKFLENYYTGDDTTRNNFVESVVGAVGALKSSEGLESVLAGFMLGGIATGAKKVGEKYSKDNPKTERDIALEAANNYNSANEGLYADLFNDTTKELAGLMSRNIQSSHAELGAQLINDEFTVGLLEKTSFADTVTTYAQVGKFDELISQLEAAKNTPVDRISELTQAESVNKLTEDEKNTIADTAIEQAKKIKDNYESLVRTHSSELSHKDIAKIAVVDTLQDYVDVSKKDIKTQLKPLFDIDAEVRDNYLTPDAVTTLKDENSVLLQSINSLKSKASTEKTSNYNAEIEQLSNKSNDILKRIESSLTDEIRIFEDGSKKKEGETESEKNERYFSRDYKSSLITKLNDKLRTYKQVIERNKGDLTEFKKYERLVSQFEKVQNIQDSIIDTKNEFAKNPTGYFDKVNSDIREIRELAEKDALFTIDGQAPIKGGIKDFKLAKKLTIKPGLYYEAKGRATLKDKKNPFLKSDTPEEKVAKLNTGRNKREFTEIVDTFIKVSANSRKDAWVKVKEGDTIKEYPLSYFEGKLNTLESTLGSTLTDGKIREEEAFYLQYKDKIIQYQYKVSSGAEPVILHGMVAYNSSGFIVLRHITEHGYIHDTLPFQIIDKEGNKIKKGNSFQISYDHPNEKTRVESSQYLRVLSKEESDKYIEIRSLELQKTMYENMLNKKKNSLNEETENDTKQTTSLVEDVIVSEHIELKKKLIEARDKIQEKLSNLKGKTGVLSTTYTKLIEQFQAKIDSISKFEDMTNLLISEYETNIKVIDNLIAKAKKKSVKKELIRRNDKLLNTLNVERVQATKLLKELVKSKEGFKENKETFFETVKLIRQDFTEIIDADKLYNSEFISKVVQALPDYSIQDRFNNKDLKGEDLEEIFSYILENNGDTVEYLNTEGQLEKLEVKLEELEDIGNEAYDDKFSALSEIITSLDKTTVQALVAVKNNRKGDNVDEKTGANRKFYDDLINRIDKIVRSLKRDETESYFKSKNLKFAGEDDVFITTSESNVASPKKTILQGLTTTSPNVGDFKFNETWDYVKKSQWLFQKFLNDIEDDIDDYLIEYLIEDSGKYVRYTESDKDVTQKAILVRILDKNGEPVKLNSMGVQDPKGFFEAITTLEAGSEEFRQDSKLGKVAKYRETDEYLALEEEALTTSPERLVEIKEEIAELKGRIKEGLEGIQKERETILEVLNKGERFVTKISDKSIGIAIPYFKEEEIDGQKVNKRQYIELKSAFGSNFKDKIREGILKVEIIKPDTKIGGKALNISLGSVVVYETNRKNPKVYILKINNISNEQAYSVAKNIYDFALQSQQNLKPEFSKLYNLIRGLVYWGSINDINKDFSKKEALEANKSEEKELKKKAYHIRFKYGSNSTILEYGNFTGYDKDGKPEYDIQEIDALTIRNNKEFIKWVESKKVHITSKAVVNLDTIGDKLIKNATINLQPKTNLQFQSIYVTPTGERLEKFKEKSKKSTNINPPKGDVPKGNTGTSDLYKGVVFKDLNYKLDDNLTIEEATAIVNAKFKSGELAFSEGIKNLILKDKEVRGVESTIDGIDDMLLILSTRPSTIAAETLAYEYNSGEDENSPVLTYLRPLGTVAFLNAYLQTAIDKKGILVDASKRTGEDKNTTETKSTESTDIDVLDILKDEFEENKSVTDEADDSEYPFMKFEELLDLQPKIRLDKLVKRDDFKDYKQVVVKVTKGLIAGVGFGRLKEIIDELGNISYLIEVSENAPLGTEYHEKFHLFEKALFSKAQLKKLYNQWREATGQNLTDAEVSEKLAEEFRYFSLTRDLENNQLKGSKEAGIFKKVFEFIENILKDIGHLLSYNKNNAAGKGIKTLFEQLYDNKVNDRPVTSYFKTTVSKSKFSLEELKAMSKAAMLRYYQALESEIKDFNYLDFFSDKEYRETVKEQYISKFKDPLIDDMSMGTDAVLLEQIAYDFKTENRYISGKLQNPENRKAFIENFTEYYNQINGELLNIDDIDINDESATGGKGENGYDFEPTSVNHIVKSPIIINQLLSTIAGEKNFLDFAEHIDIDDTKVSLVKLLVEETSEREILDNLIDSPNKIFKIVASRLNEKSNNSSINGLNRLTQKNQILNFFRKQILEFHQINVDTDNKVVTVDINKQARLEKESSNFNNVFKALFPTSSTAKLSELLAPLSKIDNDKLLPLLGFDVNVDKFMTWDRKIKNKVDLDKITSSFGSVFRDTKDLQDIIDNPSGFHRFKQLLNLIVEFKNENTPVQVLIDNKPQYSIVERNFIYKKILELKKKYPTGFVKNENISEQVKEEIEKILRSKIKYGSAIKTEDELQRVSEMTEKPTLIYHINSAINSNISPFINTGDKSSYFAFQDLAQIKKGGATIEDYVEQFKSIFEHEYNTFTKFKSADENIVLPKIDNYFAVTKSLFNRENEEKDLEYLLLDENRQFKFESFKDFYNTLENEYIEGIQNFRARENAALLELLIDNGLYNEATQQFKYIDKASMDTNEIYNVEDLVDVLNLFFIESNILQAKYIVGDLGFYGLNLAKRVPAAMSVKKSGSYDIEQARMFSDGGEFKLSNNNINFDTVDADGELVFDALVMDDFYHHDAVLGAIHEAYKTTTITDGFAFEHIDALRFRENQEGTWTDEDEALYQADLKGEVDLETFTKWSIKKTQYFGDQLVEFGKNFSETMKVPTLYKFSTLTLSNNLINKSNSSILRAIKELMEENNLPLVMFDSANKITRKGDYQLLSENALEEEITYTDENYNPCAAIGLTNTVSGSNWKIVKDFKGQPKHSQGGVDITVSNNGININRGNKDIKAANGLVIESEKIN